MPAAEFLFYMNFEPSFSHVPLIFVAESKPIIYFATWGGGIKAYSGSQVRTIVKSNESCYAVTYDSIQKKIYWSTYEQSKTYRANVDGSDVEIILNLNKSKFLPCNGSKYTDFPYCVF